MYTNKKIYQITYKLYKMALFVVLLCIITKPCEAQKDSIKLVKYSIDYKFKDGLFLNLGMLVQNNPIPKSRIITSIDMNSYSFFEKLFESENISIYDDIGNEVRLKQEDIWGFGQNGAIYIYCNNDYSRISIIGSICHFVSNRTTTVDTRNPFDYYDRRYSSFNPSVVQSTVMVQYILDIEGGKVLEFTTESVETILMRDNELYDEFKKLKPKKQRDQKFLFVRRYNEKHPLMLPVIQ